MLMHAVSRLLAPACRNFLHAGTRVPSVHEFTGMLLLLDLRGRAHQNGGHDSPFYMCCTGLPFAGWQRCCRVGRARTARALLPPTH